MDIGMDPGVAAGIGVGAVSIGAVATMDRIIDVTSHDHRTRTYRLAMKPSMTASKVLLGTSIALAGAGLLAGFHDSTREYRDDLLKIGGGVMVGGLVAPMALRAGWGLTVAPAQAGWRPGARAIPQFRFGDLAANAVDRVHMMGRDPDLASRNWKLFNVISKVQGHGPLVDRIDDFAPVLRFEGVRYRTPAPHVPLIGDAPDVIASRVSP